MPTTHSKNSQPPITNTDFEEATMFVSLCADFLRGSGWETFLWSAIPFALLSLAYVLYE